MNWYRKAQEDEFEKDMGDSFNSAMALDLAGKCVKQAENHIRVSMRIIENILLLMGMKMISGGMRDQYKLVLMTRPLQLTMKEGRETSSVAKDVFEVLTNMPLQTKLEYIFPDRNDPDTVEFTIGFPMKATFTAESLNYRPSSKFIPGTKVTKNMGVRQDGVVIPHFHWKNSTDGTYKEPNKEDVPVKWDDGTQGYINRVFLEEIEI